MIHSSYLHDVFDKSRFNTIVHQAKKQLETTQFDGFAVCGNGGTLLVGALAYIMHKGILLVRKEGDESHALSVGYRVEGNDWHARRYVFLDDTICSGDTYKFVLRQMERQFPACVCVGSYIYRNGKSKRWIPNE